MMIFYLSNLEKNKKKGRESTQNFYVFVSVPTSMGAAANFSLSENNKVHIIYIYIYTSSVKTLTRYTPPMRPLY